MLNPLHDVHEDVERSSKIYWGNLLQNFWLNILGAVFTTETSPKGPNKTASGVATSGELYIYIVHMYRIYSTYVHMWCFNLLYIYTRYIYIQSYIFVCEIICGLYIANMNRACIYIYTYINWSPLSLCIFIVIMYLHCHYVYHHFTTSQKWEMFTTLMTFHYIYWLLHSSKLLHGLL